LARGLIVFKIVNPQPRFRARGLERYASADYYYYYYYYYYQLPRLVGLALVSVITLKTLQFSNPNFLKCESKC